MAGATSFSSRCWMVRVVVKYLWLCYWRSWYSIFIFTISLSAQSYVYLIWEKDICEEIKKRYLWPTCQPVWVKLNRCSSLDIYIYSLKLMLPSSSVSLFPFRQIHAKKDSRRQPTPFITEPFLCAHPGTLFIFAIFIDAEKGLFIT